MTPLESHAATEPSDFAAAREVIAAAEAHDGTPPVSDQALLSATQGSRRLVLFTAPGAGLPDAVGIVGEQELDLVVRPQSRGRGIGSAAMTALLPTEEAEPVLAWAHGENPAAEALLSAHDFTPVRSLFRMALDPARLPADGHGPAALAAPEGLELRAFDPDRPGDAGVWVRANAAAFATHPEQGRMTEADFALIAAEAWFDPSDLLLLVDDTGEAAGSTWVKTLTEPVVETELYAVGVRPERAGQGLGSFLLDATLARMAQHRPERVTLYVDGENERAVRMYEHAGFTIDSRSRQWRRGPVSAASVRMDA